MLNRQDEYLWNLAFDIAKQSTCDRFHAGCVVARDGKILSTGFNGSVDGEPHCDEAGHKLIETIEIFGIDARMDSFDNKRNLHCIRTLHSEINAIINAAYNGVNISDADWYVNGIPCWGCSKAIARLKPRRCFFYAEGYKKETTIIDWWEEQNPLAFRIGNVFESSMVWDFDRKEENESNES